MFVCSHIQLRRVVVVVVIVLLSRVFKCWEFRATVRRRRQTDGRRGEREREREREAGEPSWWWLWCLLPMDDSVGPLSLDCIADQIEPCLSCVSKGIAGGWFCLPVLGRADSAQPSPIQVVTKPSALRNSPPAFCLTRPGLVCVCVCVCECGES